MPSHVQSCLLVKISSSGRGPACPPVIIKERREPGSGNRGISTHHFSALERSAPCSVHQPLTDLFTAQSGLCLAARCTFKSSFDTPPPRLQLTVSAVSVRARGISTTVWPLYGRRKGGVGERGGEGAQRVAIEVAHYAGLDAACSLQP